MFLLITHVASWLRLSRRQETRKTAETLILRHQLAIMQRRQPRRLRLNWADRTLLAAERHLQSVLADYAWHYDDRTEAASRARPGPITPSQTSQERIKRRAHLGGLINEYERAA